MLNCYRYISWLKEKQHPFFHLDKKHPVLRNAIFCVYIFLRTCPIAMRNLLSNAQQLQLLFLVKRKTTWFSYLDKKIQYEGMPIISDFILLRTCPI